MLKQVFFKTLLSPDIFQYPLTLSRLTRLHPVSESVLRGGGRIGKYDRPWTNPAGRRLLPIGGESFMVGATAAQCAGSGGETAKKRSGFVAAFPYVEAVMVWLAFREVTRMEAGSDIELFVITRPGRLWIARTMLIAYRSSASF
ncbi:MAG: hypothetical protein U0176_10050 [Bacteroidia bacterium]